MTRAPAPARSAAVIGPNAVIQLGRALLAGPGRRAAEEVFDAASCADLLDAPPQRMTDEALVRRLYQALWRVRPGDASGLARESGARTAGYVIQNRIPRAARWLMRAAPPPVAARLLLVAIRRNAWTFAGSGACEISVRPYAVEIRGNPLAMPHGVWHSAVFTRLFRELVSPRTRVRHSVVHRGGAAACRFDIDLS